MTWFGNEITLKDGPQLSAFGKLKTTTSHTVFDSQQEYGLDTLRVWDCAANGTAATASSNGSAVNGSNAVGPTDSNTRLTPITVSSTNGHYSVLQQRIYNRYIPGKGHITYITGIFAAGSSYTAALNLRTSTSGSVVDTTVAQSSWNQDKLDGTGASGLTIDFTKIQIMVIDAQMLYAGRVRVGFDINGILYWAHYFYVANLQSVPTMQTYNLPVRLEGRTGASTTVFNVGYFDSANGIFLSTTRSITGGTINFECCSVQNEGEEELRGFPNSTPNGISTIAVTTRRPILSIRPKATYNSRTNRAHISEIEAVLRATTNDSLYELVIGGTLTGASWTSVATDSCAEYDVSATAISGGSVLKQGFVVSGSGSTANTTGLSADIRSRLALQKIDGLTAVQTPITLVCTSFSGTSNVTGIFNWHEQII